MAPGTIVRYTKDSGGFRWDQVGVDVDPENALEVVAPDVADLVDGDPSIPLEKYPAGDVNTDISIVDGLDIAPNSVTSDSVSTDKGRFKGVPWYDVTQYGAVGDGATDDSQAVQDAIDAAATGTGTGVVYYPEPDSSYFFGDWVLANSGVFHIAPRPYSSKITVGDIGTNAVFQGPHINGDAAKNIGFYGLTIDGTNGWTSSGYSPSQKHIFVKPSATDDGSRNLWVERCHLIDSPASSLGCDSIFNQHFRYNCVEKAGTDGESTGSNAIGIGAGEITGYCPTWIVGNVVDDAAEFGIIIEQTGGTEVSWGYQMDGNVVNDARVGIAAEQIRGLSASDNTVVSTTRTDRGFYFDTLDGTFGIKQARIDGAHLIDGGDAPDTETFEFGADATFATAEGITQPVGGPWNAPVNNGSFCAIGGIGKEAAGSGNSPTWTDRWENVSVSQVRNTDDGTVYVPDQNGGWDKIV